MNSKTANKVVFVATIVTGLAVVVAFFLSAFCPAGGPKFITNGGWISDGDIVIVTDAFPGNINYPGFRDGVYFAKINDNINGLPSLQLSELPTSEPTCWVYLDGSKRFRKFIGIERLIVHDTPEYHTYVKVQLPKQIITSGISK